VLLSACHQEHRPPACHQPAKLRQGGFRVNRDEATWNFGPRATKAGNAALALEGRFVLIAELIDNLRGDSKMPLKRRLRPYPSGAACAPSWTVRAA
jgi:hypothetical protein